MPVTGSTKPSEPKARPVILGVAGGSGSGKTYFSTALQNSLGTDLCEIVYQDNFYIDQSHRFDFDGGSVNFDHPDSIDFHLLSLCLRKLKEGRPAEIPIYDFKTHKRVSQSLKILPKPLIIVDGILIFHSEPVRNLFDHKVYFDTAEEIRYSRRLSRDIHERGRTEEGVRNQFQSQVKPMHDAFVEPSKAYADTVVSENQNLEVILDHFCQKFGL
jgi:uridine kinase